MSTTRADIKRCSNLQLIGTKPSETFNHFLQLWTRFAGASHLWRQPDPLDTAEYFLRVAQQLLTSFASPRKTSRDSGNSNPAIINLIFRSLVRKTVEAHWNNNMETTTHFDHVWKWRPFIGRFSVPLFADCTFHIEKTKNDNKTTKWPFQVPLGFFKGIVYFL